MNKNQTTKIINNFFFNHSRVRKIYWWCLCDKALVWRICNRRPLSKSNDRCCVCVCSCVRIKFLFCWPNEYTLKSTLPQKKKNYTKELLRNKGKKKITTMKEMRPDFKKQNYNKKENRLIKLEKKKWKAKDDTYIFSIEHRSMNYEINSKKGTEKKEENYSVYNLFRKSNFSFFYSLFFFFSSCVNVCGEIFD